MDLSKFCRAHLAERVDITDDLAVFRFRPERPLHFEAGQYATLALPGGDKLVQRAYSIVSSPHEDDLEFFIELVPQGELTPRLWELHAGDELLVRCKIVGRFTRDPLFSHHLMLATVTGIAPYLSMMRLHRHALERGEATPGHFAILHGASVPHELGPYLDEMAAMHRAGLLHYIPTISRPWLDDGWTGETGRVEDVARKHADALGFTHAQTVAYACGHPQMIENARSLVARARFPREQFRDEKYFTA